MSDMETPRPFTYAIEISHDHQSLDEARKVALEYLKGRAVEYEIALESRARLVVKFTDMQSAQNFYFSTNGRFVGLPSRPFEITRAPE
jgi:hypothetical protein